MCVRVCACLCARARGLTACKGPGVRFNTGHSACKIYREILSQASPGRARPIVPGSIPTGIVPFILIPIAVCKRDRERDVGEGGVV